MQGVVAPYETEALELSAVVTDPTLRDFRGLWKSHLLLNWQGM